MVKSYQGDRKFIVNINNIFTDSGELLFGVPQGSILGPLFFLLQREAYKSISLIWNHKGCNYMYYDSFEVKFIQKETCYDYMQSDIFLIRANILC